MKDWEFQYNGLLFGANHDIQIINVTGLDPPDARVSVVPKPGDHGSWVFAQYLSERTIDISGDITKAKAKDFQKLVDRLSGAFKPQGNDLKLRFRIAGLHRRYVLCRPTRVDFPIDTTYSGLKQCLWSIELVAGDPRIYGHELKRHDLNLNDNYQATNDGNFPMWPIVSFHDALTNPRISNADTGEFLKLNATLTSGHYIKVDFAKRTIINDAGTNKYDTLDQTSTWWDLGSGTHKIHFQADSGSGYARFEWRNAWL